MPPGLAVSEIDSRSGRRAYRAELILHLRGAALAGGVLALVCATAGDPGVAPLFLIGALAAMKGRIVVG
jgi:hypothetical protein